MVSWSSHQWRLASSPRASSGLVTGWTLAGFGDAVAGSEVGDASVSAFGDGGGVAEFGGDGAGDDEVGDEGEEEDFSVVEPGFEGFVLVGGEGDAEGAELGDGVGGGGGEGGDEEGFVEGGAGGGSSCALGHVA